MFVFLFATELGKWVFLVKFMHLLRNKNWFSTIFYVNYGTELFLFVERVSLPEKIGRFQFAPYEAGPESWWKVRFETPFP